MLHLMGRKIDVSFYVASNQFIRLYHINIAYFIGIFFA